jgi:hypothetical protein
MAQPLLLAPPPFVGARRLRWRCYTGKQVSPLYGKLHAGMWEKTGANGVLLQSCCYFKIYTVLATRTVNLERV